MDIVLSEKELEVFGKNEDLIRMNLISKAVYNESLKYEFNQEDLKNIWFNEENLVLDLYMRKKVEPRVMVNENSILDVYNNNKEYFEKNKINFSDARQIIKNNLVEEMNKGLFEDLVKKLMNEMEESISLTKDDLLFTKGDPQLIKAVLLISVLKENAKKDSFFEENNEEIELLKKEARLNYYLNKLVEEKAIVPNQLVLDEMQRISKENFEAVKSYSQDELFHYVGNQLLNQKVNEVRNEILSKIAKEYAVEDKVKEYVGNNE